LFSCVGWTRLWSRFPRYHQQPEVNYLPRFSPQLISLERYTLSVYRAGEIDLFENLDIVHIRLLVGCNQPSRAKQFDRLDCKRGVVVR